MSCWKVHPSSNCCRFSCRIDRFFGHRSGNWMWRMPLRESWQCGKFLFISKCYWHLDTNIYWFDDQQTQSCPHQCDELTYCLEPSRIPKELLESDKIAQECSKFNMTKDDPSSPGKFIPNFYISRSFLKSIHFELHRSISYEKVRDFRQRYRLVRHNIISKSFQLTKKC
jgi:hypothetical protein